MAMLKSPLVARQKSPPRAVILGLVEGSPFGGEPRVEDAGRPGGARLKEARALVLLEAKTERAKGAAVREIQGLGTGKVDGKSSEGDGDRIRAKAFIGPGDMNLDFSFGPAGGG